MNQNIGTMERWYNLARIDENRMLNECEYNPIYKRKYDRLARNNHRAISLLNALEKSFEEVDTQMDEHMPTMPFGYRAGKCSRYSLVNLLENINVLIKRRKK